MAEVIIIKDREALEKINDIDIENAVAIVSEFWDVPACTIVKDGFPIGVGLGATIYDAKMKAIDCNPVDSIGETIAFSKNIDKITAQILIKLNFKTIITTGFEDDCQKYFEKSDCKVILLDLRLDIYKKEKSEKEKMDITPKGFKIATKLKPTQEQVEDMVFAWKILKTIQKGAVVVAKDFKAISIEAGQNTKVIEKALDNACDGSKEAVLAISKNICDIKQLNPIIQGRISGIIEPKNLLNEDIEVIKTADKYGITVITVGAE